MVAWNAYNTKHYTDIGSTITRNKALFVSYGTHYAYISQCMRAYHKEWYFEWQDV